MPVVQWRRFYTAPDDPCQQVVLDAAQAATVSLHVLIYALTMRPLLDILKDKQRAGLCVGVVADQSQSTGHIERPLLQDLVDHGVPVTIATSPTGAIMHTKALIIDQELGAEHEASYVVYGSMNFSATGPQQANFVVIENEATMVDYLWKAYQALEQYGHAHVPQLVPSTQGSP